METTAEARPTAAQNCEWVRARMAQEGLEVTGRPVTLIEATSWLLVHRWCMQQVFQAFGFVMVAAPRTRLICGPGWRLLCNGLLSDDPFTLLTVSKKSCILIESSEHADERT